MNWTDGELTKLSALLAYAIICRSTNISEEKNLREWLYVLLTACVKAAHYVGHPKMLVNMYEAIMEDHARKMMRQYMKGDESQ